MPTILVTGGAGFIGSNIASALAARPGVTEVHDLHVWAMSTTETALTAHLIRPDNAGCDAFLRETAEGLGKTFGIGHPTLQVETGDGDPCRLAPADVV